MLWMVRRSRGLEAWLEVVGFSGVCCRIIRSGLVLLGFPNSSYLFLNGLVLLVVGRVFNLETALLYLVRRFWVFIPDSGLWIFDPRIVGALRALTIVRILFYDC